MQEVFEKILDKLEQFRHKSKEGYDKYGIGIFDAKHDAYKVAIEIVKQAEVEYKEGWTPCSERLPKRNPEKAVYDMVLVTLENGDVTTGVYRDDDEAWWARPSQGGHCYSKEYVVVAWQPLPEPYKGD